MKIFYTEDYVLFFGVITLLCLFVYASILEDRKHGYKVVGVDDTEVVVFSKDKNISLTLSDLVKDYREKGFYLISVVSGKGKPIDFKNIPKTMIFE